MQTVGDELDALSVAFAGSLGAGAGSLDAVFSSEATCSTGSTVKSVCVEVGASSKANRWRRCGA